MFTENANRIFNRVIEEYHRWDDVDRPVENPYEPGTIDHLLYHKNWIDTVQWHLEDIIRDPQIDPVAALAIKRRIDKSNQERTDMVEYVDSYLLDKYREIEPLPGARLNTETPAWAIDRLSILALKIYHMACETERTDVDDAHRAAAGVSNLRNIQSSAIATYSGNWDSCSTIRSRPCGASIPVRWVKRRGRGSVSPLSRRSRARPIPNRWPARRCACLPGVMTGFSSIAAGVPRRNSRRRWSAFILMSRRCSDGLRWRARST